MYASQYVDNDVLNKDSVELVCLLYAKAIEKLRLAASCFTSDDIAGRTKAIGTAQEILLELQGSLDAEQGGEIAVNLDRLYVYLQERLSHANARQDAAAVDEVVRLLEVVYEGWRAPHREELRHAAAAAVPDSELVGAGKVWEL